MVDKEQEKEITLNENQRVNQEANRRLLKAHVDKAKLTWFKEIFKEYKLALL